MPGERQEDTDKNNHPITLRWKIMLALSIILIALGNFVDWSPSENASLPDTSVFLVILGIFLGLAGLLTATRR